jgi:hypothetical protein
VLALGKQVPPSASGNTGSGPRVWSAAFAFARSCGRRRFTFSLGPTSATDHHGSASRGSVRRMPGAARPRSAIGCVRHARTCWRGRTTSLSTTPHDCDNHPRSPWVVLARTLRVSLSRGSQAYVWALGEFGVRAGRGGCGVRRLDAGLWLG